MVKIGIYLRKLSIAKLKQGYHFLDQPVHVVYRSSTQIKLKLKVKVKAE